MGVFQSGFPGPYRTYSAGGLAGQLNRTIFAQTAVATVGNTAVETTLMSTSGAVGSKTIPASYLKAGNYIKVYLSGSIETDAIPPLLTLTLYYGAEVLSTVAVTPGAIIAAGTYFEYTATINARSVGATGDVVSGQVMRIDNATTPTIVAVPAVQVTDTTAAGAIDVKITWGTADAQNTISVLTGYIEVIG